MTGDRGAAIRHGRVHVELARDVHEHFADRTHTRAGAPGVLVGGEGVGQRDELAVQGIEVEHELLAHLGGRRGVGDLCATSDAIGAALMASDSPMTDQRRDMRARMLSDMETPEVAVGRSGGPGAERDETVDRIRPSSSPSVPPIH